MQSAAIHHRPTPYVFVFLASFFFISIANFGVRTTVLFTLIT